jgi:hypothetical protein
MKFIEKSGAFYLGKKVGSDEPLFYDSKNLMTHALCVGMTGSGKTGLGIGLIEEASLTKIPSILIDPKGDLANLLLTFPDLSPEEFKPWTDDPEKVAKTWKEGLAKWGEDGERIKRLKDSVEMVIYTPASQSGIPLSILSSFKAPPKELLSDKEAIRDRVLSVASSVLGLLGISADPIKSREHILISTLLDNAWVHAKDLDIATLIEQVQKPPFDKIGALDIDTFFPPKERMVLSISLNNLLASPGFKAWVEGEPLDIQNLLYTKEGKPKCSILSIAHLSDKERMFFVTLFLNELLIWLRRQSGTSSLRALFYMDEIFGYFPPTSMPPSKIPMLTLLKQARAFGLGVVLSTQNPVDLDYKGLANCGTWFIGKLQTERDRARVLEGLNIASNGDLSSKELDKMIASTGNRIFLQRSIYAKEPILFETRWTLSYLRGPLTLPQIASLTKKTGERLSPKEPPKAAKPLLPPGIQEIFVKSETSVHYRPYVLGLAKLHFVDAKNKIDVWKDVCLIASLDSDGVPLWDQAKEDPAIKDRLDKTPQSGSTFDSLPSGLKSSNLEKTFATALYQNQTLSAGEEAIKKVREKYDQKIALVNERLKRAQEKLSQKKQKVWWQIADTLASFGSAILGVLVGKKVTKGAINQTGTSLRRAGRIGKEHQDAASAEEDIQTYQQQIEDLEDQEQQEIEETKNQGVRPRKSDISIDKVALLWMP